jgi:hypothetical protein
LKFIRKSKVEALGKASCVLNRGKGRKAGNNYEVAGVEVIAWWVEFDRDGRCVTASQTACQGLTSVGKLKLDQALEVNAAQTSDDSTILYPFSPGAVDAHKPICTGPLSKGAIHGASSADFCSSF